ncbi:helix-turn-helix domain-containing protein [Methylobacterium sp. SD274]|uniref:winged helix-turn-helix domain-containing protein n=1 Tax=Methylobacterium sp. SD274 TaxID=2782009 RepID=UPI001A969202|nr:winged helix-turn-helix domain-containing protein [Methylobacterium sp. SD274]MBO1019148.1 helix-turn-helix domain-containing protein [Methylobacterium sp. SD274]
MTKSVRMKPIIKTTRSKAVAVRPQASMQVLTDQFGIEVEDKFKISGSSGFVNVHVEKSDGRVVSHKFKANKNFRQMTVYNKSNVDANERREIVAQLDRDGHSQAAIADQLGVSQPTISLDLKRLKAEKRLG